MVDTFLLVSYVAKITLIWVQILSLNFIENNTALLILNIIGLVSFLSILLCEDKSPTLIFFILGNVFLITNNILIAKDIYCITILILTSVCFVLGSTYLFWINFTLNYPYSLISTYHNFIKYNNHLISFCFISANIIALLIPFLDYLNYDIYMYRFLSICLLTQAFISLTTDQTIKMINEGFN